MLFLVSLRTPSVFLIYVCTLYVLMYVYNNSNNVPRHMHTHTHTHTRTHIQCTSIHTTTRPRDAAAVGSVGKLEW
jgi:hypothetical protein